jgi:polysaccharide export outer membrane protein
MLAVSKRVCNAVLILALAWMSFSCASYKQNIMFVPGEDYVPPTIERDALEAEKNYVIQVNDYLKLEVFSNKGERIIDPNGELQRDLPNNQNQQNRTEPNYLVTVNGTVKFPMIDTVKLTGFTIRQAESILQREYDKYYKECFVILTFANKRVLVLGAVGGKVIPLANENVTLTEVLSSAGGIGIDGKAQNIRLVRDNDVYIIDFSTIDGLKKANMIVQPGDLVYVEPLRRPFVEGFRDYAPIISMIISTTTLVLLLIVETQ